MRLAASIKKMIAGATMWQLLSLPMMAVGAWLVVRGMRLG
jgi:hypothetical protein